MIEIIKGIIGMFLLIGATDMVGRLFWKREDGLSGRWLSWLVSYFTVITPIFYILNLFKLEINYLSVIGMLTVVWLGIGLITKKKIFEFGKLKIKGIFFWFLGFLALHLIFYSIYFTIPEWDSYRNIISVRENIASGSIVSNYRPLFNASMTIFSVASSIDPYSLFPIILIIAQSSLLFSIYLIDKDNRNKMLRGLLLASALAVPVISMEIDIPRAQSVLLILLPIFFYFLNIFYSTKKETYSLLTLFWISIIGISYHEFFFSLALLIIAIAAIKMFESWHLGGKKDKLIVVLLIIIAFLSVFLGYNYIFTFKVVVGNIQIILNNLINNFHWKWWFLNNDLSADMMSIAWNGWKSVSMYYAYYLSPIILGWLILTIITAIKKHKITNFQYCLLFVGGIFLAFVEILPRMNIGILPERSWVFLDVIILLLVASNLKDIKISKVCLYILFSLILVGFVGSFYVAIGKKSLTSSNEMKASVWISENTAKESIFISQQSNNQLIKFFGNRIIQSPNSDYFLSDKLVQQETASICESVKTIPSVENLRNEVLNFDIQKGDINKLSANIISVRTEIQKYNKECYPNEIFTRTPIYILFSQEKLQSIYSTREWWREVNYFGANLDKFDIYPLVYDNRGVKIWRVR